LPAGALIVLMGRYAIAAIPGVEGGLASASRAMAFFVSSRILPQSYGAAATQFCGKKSAKKLAKD
jgi:hypothetical protein